MSGAGRLCVALAAAVALAGCTSCTSAPPPPPPPPQLDAADPDPSRVEALLLLVGDAGDALPGQSPVLAAVSSDVERWAPRLEPEAVRVALLGDLIYPEGLRAPGEPEHARDSLRLHAQLTAVLGPAGRAAGARLDLLTGNHDWAGEGGATGRERVQQLADHVARWQAAGVPAALRPSAGSLGPEVVDVGSAHRLLFLDTQAWLYADEATRRGAAAALTDAMRAAPERSVTVLAHHPLVSGGEHGLTPPADGVVDALRAAAARTGILVQDAWSEPYQALIDGARVAFRNAARPPLVWAAGHDHSLQVIGGTEPGDARWTVISGSASRLHSVAAAPGMVLGGAWPGYARLFLLDDGSAVLQVAAGSPGSAHCPRPESLDACMAAATATYHTVFSRRLR